jgi:hypothetical protein
VIRAAHTGRIAGAAPAARAPAAVRTAGTTIMFNSVDVINLHRMTMAMGVWTSLPACPPASASGTSASAAVTMV